MTQTEALKLALEALEYFSDTSPNMAGKAHAEDAITAIKAALEAKDEPFGYFRYDLRLDAWVQSRDSNQGVAFYTTPPQRKPLTDEEASEIGQQANRFDWLTDYSEAIDFVIEATTTKLKEKNK